MNILSYFGVGSSQAPTEKYKGLLGKANENKANYAKTGWDESTKQVMGLREALTNVSTTPQFNNNDLTFGLLALSKKFDTNEDNTLSDEELGNFMASIDQDGDGQITDKDDLAGQIRQSVAHQPNDIAQDLKSKIQKPANMDAATFEAGLQQLVKETKQVDMKIGGKTEAITTSGGYNDYASQARINEMVASLGTSGADGNITLSSDGFEKIHAAAARAAQSNS